MLDKLTNKVMDKLYNEFKKDDTQKKINDLMKPLLVKLFYILIPYLGVGILLYLVLLVLMVYIIFSLKKISTNII
jgi:hypothetical protein